MMVRTYKRKTSTKYTPEALQAAVKAIKEHGMSRSAAAYRFDVPPPTCFYHISGEYSKVGAEASTILSSAEEKEIVITLQVLQEIGFGMTKELVGVIIHDYLKDQPTRPNPFSMEYLVKIGGGSFLRDKQLSMRKPQHLPTSRASATTPEAIGS